MGAGQVAIRQSYTCSARRARPNAAATTEPEGGRTQQRGIRGELAAIERAMCAAGEAVVAVVAGVVN